MLLKIVSTIVYIYFIKPGLEYLTQINKLVVKQKVEVLEGNY